VPRRFRWFFLGALGASERSRLCGSGPLGLPGAPPARLARPGRDDAGAANAGGAESAAGAETEGRERLGKRFKKRVFFIGG
jgi:hypothetical protein